jgi:tetratricopeptide (TPR) repeat protein
MSTICPFTAGLVRAHSCLLASQRLAGQWGWHTTVWQLAWVLDTFNTRRGHLHDNLAAWEAGLDAARREDDATLILAYRFLGYACALVGKHADALDHLRHTLSLADNTKDVPGLAHAHYALAEAWGQRGDDHQALEHATSALHLYQTLDQPVWEADMLNSVGWYSARLGEYQQARTRCEAALALSRRHRHIVGEAATLNSLGYLAQHTGQHDQALDYYQQARTRYHDLSYTYAEADTLDRLAQTHAVVGHHDQARHAWQQALELYQMQHRVDDTQRVQRQLDEVNESTREP